MSRTKTARPVLLALLGLLVIVATLRPITPSAASDTDVSDDAEVAIDESTTTTTIVEATTSTTVVEETTTTTAAPADEDAVDTDASDDPAADDETPAGDETPDPAVTEEDDATETDVEPVADDRESDDADVKTATKDKKTSDSDKKSKPGPDLAVSKTVVSGPTIDASGNYTVTYRIAVTNSGGKGGYKLEDALYFGGGISITSTKVTNLVPGNITANRSWKGTSGSSDDIVDNETIPAGATHVYQVVVKGTIDPGISTSAGDCDTTTGDFNTGFLNGTLVTAENQQQAWDAACAEVEVAEALVADIRLSKRAVTGPTYNAAGNYELTYDIVVTNDGTSAGVYDLGDRIFFGGGIVIVASSISNVIPGTIAINPAWNGITQHQVALGVPIGAGEAHTYRVFIEANVSPDITDDAKDCLLDHGEEGTGFLNKALIRVDGVDGDDWDCREVPDPEIDIEKTLTSGPTLNGAGNYDVTYDVVVSNTGQGPGVYDLSDELTYGDGITVVDASVANTVPGSITTNASWDGLTDLVVATGVGIVPLSSHTYTVTVEASVAATTTGTARDCVIDQGEDGTGFLNVATITVDGVETSDDDCGQVPGPVITIDKTLTSGPTLNGSGNYDVTYDVVVSNTGDGPGVYDLSDELTYGDGITVVDASVANTIPGSITTNASWDGLTDLVVATGVDITAGDAHTYTVTVEASVAATTTGTARDCVIDQGEDGTGFLNVATITFDGGILEDDDCAEVPGPEWELTKTLTSGPTLNGAGNYDVGYDVVVSNTGDGPGVYDLSDELTYGDGITVVDASVANTIPGSITTNASWDGLTDLVVATGVATGPGESHTYTVTVEASVAVTTTATARDCVIDQGEDGTGFLNTATITFDGGILEDDDCAEVPGAELELTKDLTSVVLNGDGTSTVAYKVVVDSVGAGPTTYDLSDELMFGEGVTIHSAAVVNDAPGTITTNAGWDGVADLVVATGVDIAAGEQHVYLVAVVVTVSADITETAADCELTVDEDGTGYLNTATLTYEDVTLEDEDCAPVNPDPDDDPTIEVELEAVCDNDTPWLAYEILVSDGITATTATVTFAATGGSEAFVVDLGSGRILWPGAAVDAAGNPIDWPGWDLDEDGNWFVNPDNPYIWAHGDVEVTVEVNPTYGPVTLTYPPAEPTCDAAPPTDDDPNGDDDDPNGDPKLPHTGMSTTLFGSIGLAMLALGSILVLKVRRRQEDV